MESEYQKYKKRKLYISDVAFERLLQNAYELNYVRISGVARGIHYYFAALAQLTYTDERPVYMRDTHQWSTGVNYPRQREIRMTERTVVEFAVIALTHGIAGYRSQRAVIDGIRAETLLTGYQNPAVLPGPVLEAIGLGWLRPSSDVPRAPAALHRMSEAAHRKMTRYRRGQRSWYGQGY